MLNMEAVQLLEQLQKKGTLAETAGATGAGKTTLLSALAESAATGNTLRLRVSEGKGSLEPAIYTVTDHPDIAEDSVYLSIMLSDIESSDVDDENDFASRILYAAANEHVKAKKLPEAAYKAQAERAFRFEINPYAANNSLGHKLLILQPENRRKILEEIWKFPLADVVGLYIAAQQRQNEAGKKGQRVKREFRYLLSESTRLRMYVQDFWSCVCGEMNSVKNLLLRQIETEYPADKYFLSSERNRLMIVIGPDEVIKHEYIVKALLQSRERSMEYLFSDIHILFRSKTEVFNIPGAEAFTVMVDKQPIHAIRLLDTMGLFHDPESTVDDEYNRLRDSLSKYEVTNLLFVTSADIQAQIKDSYEVLNKLFSETNRSFGVYVISTSLDKMLHQKINDTSDDMWADGEIKFNPEQAKWLINEQDTYIQQLVTAAQEANGNKFKPIFRGIFRYGMQKGDKDAKDFMKDNGYSFSNCIPRLFGNIAEQSAIKSKISIRVIKGDVPEFGGRPFNFVLKQDMRACIDKAAGNILQCSDKKYWAATVRAVLRKGSIGEKFSSNINENTYDYKNITMDFPVDLTFLGYRLAQSFDVKQVTITNGTFKNDINDDSALFYDKLSEKLIRSLGGRFSGNIFMDAKVKGFQKEPECYYRQYIRFGFLLDYLQDHYGIRTTEPEPTMVDNLREIFEKTVFDIIGDIVNQECILVY